ncbi:hypothetical protein VitviT2T_023077 [Vitis vinifera]|uniref:Protein kinase domain-containing protein n=1 Tax=Vitis vinifera TaxID=29760 RepID=A0ABY9DBX5_VITVI|nr:hypothetical protein VitviT2T_023077 [Vitis vinifera]
MLLIYVKLHTYQIFRVLYLPIGVCHGDIKLHNLLVNSQTHQLKLCDFGGAKVLVKGEPNISYICSRYYRAPEFMFRLMLGQPLLLGESGVNQLVEIIKVLGTSISEEIKRMNLIYTEFKFPYIIPISLSTPHHVPIFQILVCLEHLQKGIVDSSGNAVMVVQFKARHIVTQNKWRYLEGGFDLGMTYITEKIVAIRKTV